MFDPSQPGLPEPRQLNDFADPLPGAPEIVTPGDENEMGGETADAMAVHDGMSQSLRDGLDRLALAVTGYLHGGLRVANWKREQYNFSWRMIRNKLRGNNNEWVNLDATGSVVFGPNLFRSTQSDQWAGANQDVGLYPGRVVTQGWSSSAIRTAASICNARLFEATQDFMMWTDPANKQEGKKVARCLTKLSQYLFREADFDRTGRAALYDIFQYGTCAIRAGFYTPVINEKMPTGGYEERQGDVLASFERWPLEDVFWSNPEKPEAKDQEMVWWIRRGVNVHDIERDEAVFDWADDGMGGQMMRKVSGRYTNLNCLRDMDNAGPTQTLGNVSTDPNVTIRSEIRGDLSSYPTFDLVEYEGSLPISQWLDEKILTPEILDYFGVELGPAPDPEDPRAVKAYNRKASKLKNWEVAYINENSITGNADPAGTKMLLQFSVCPYTKAQNSLYIFKAYRDSNRSYGMSVSDRGYKMEDAADILLNATMWTRYFNAYPSVISDPNVFETNFGDEIQRTFTPLQQLTRRPGMSAAEALEIMQLPDSNLGLELIGYLSQQFDTTVGITQAAKSGQGAVNTNTATQLNAEIQSTSTNLDDVQFGVIQELDRLAADVVDKLIDILGPEGFVTMLQKVCGEDSIGVEDMIPSVDGVTREYKVGHPITFGRDRNVMAAQLREDIAALQPLKDVYDIMGCAKTLAELEGNTETDRILNMPDEIFDPEDEQDQMRQLHFIRPSSAMSAPDLIYHLQTHEQEIQRIIDGEQVVPEEQEEAYFNMLVRHMKLEVALLQVLMASSMPLPGVAGQMVSPGAMMGPMPGQPGTIPGMAPGMTGGDAGGEIDPNQAGSAGQVAKGIERKAYGGRAAA